MTKLEELNHELFLAEAQIKQCKLITYNARKELARVETRLFEANEKKLLILEEIQMAKNKVEAVDDIRATHIAHLKENLPRLMEKIKDEPPIEKINFGDIDTNT